MTDKNADINNYYNATHTNEGTPEDIVRTSENIMKGAPNYTIENNLKYHKPTPEQAAKYYIEIREEAKELAYVLEKLVPIGREKSLAFTKLEEVVMWANAGIARKE